MLDFAALPPEINSARMYTGPGPGPLLASAAAWDALAAQLDSFRAGYAAIIAELHGHSWSGPASTAMAAAAAPYMEWVTTTADQAVQAAAAARAAATAYEAAFAATVPPVEVAANRTLLALLVATNFFGQNTPAITATETVYAQMWAQDAAAMYNYAAAASAAATLTPFSEPPQTVDTISQPSQAAALGSTQPTLSQLMSAIPHQLQALTAAGFTDAATAQTSAASMTAAGTSTSFITAVADFNTLLRPIFYASQLVKTPFYALSFQLAASRALTQGSTLSALTPPTAGAVGAVETPSPHPVLASMGRAAPLGGLSVPQSWAKADAAAEQSTEPVDPPQQGARALPPWVYGPEATAGAPFNGHITKSAARRETNAIFRMRDRRYQIPRPPPGG